MKFIDRTLPEMMKLKKRPSRLDLIDFCFMLQYAGVDLVEIDAATLNRIGRMPKGIRYSYRVETPDDLSRIRDWKPARCVFDQSMLVHADAIRELVGRGSDAVLEIQISDISGVSALGDIHRFLGRVPLSGLRIAGMDSLADPDALDAIFRTLQGSGLSLDFCPGNRFDLATGTATEAALRGADHVTASFCGIGGFAPLEEVLAACMLLVPELRRDPDRIDRPEDAPHSLRLNGLQTMRQQFEKLTGLSVSDRKPVIGTRIFHCESGIHVDGIRKNPATYEPYPPEWVGLARHLVIGKHSGRQALAEKLAMLKIPAEEAMLDLLLSEVRTRSVHLGHDLSDAEILRLASGHSGTPALSGRFHNGASREKEGGGHGHGEDRRYNPA